MCNEPTAAFQQPVRGRAAALAKRPNSGNRAVSKTRQPTLNYTLPLWYNFAAKLKMIFNYRHETCLFSVVPAPFAERLRRTPAV